MLLLGRDLCSFLDLYPVLFPEAPDFEALLLQYLVVFPFLDKPSVDEPVDYEPVAVHAEALS